MGWAHVGCTEVALALAEARRDEEPPPPTPAESVAAQFRGGWGEFAAGFASSIGVDLLVHEVTRGLEPV